MRQVAEANQEDLNDESGYIEAIGREAGARAVQKARGDPIVYRTAYSGEHDRETLLRLLRESEVLEPGFDYGNIGYVLASLAMDAATGTSWKDVLARELFEPLGMESTSAYRSAFDDRVLALPHGVGLAAQPFEIRGYIYSRSSVSTSS